MNKKAAISLSINTLVVVIISLVVLAGGVTLLYKFIGGADELKGNLDVRTQQELERLLIDQGKQVALPLHTTSLFPGENHVFGIGILNTAAGRKTFSVEINLLKVEYADERGVVSADTTLSGHVTNAWLNYNTERSRIEQNQHHTESILVDVPVDDADKGRYIFNAKVMIHDPTSGSTQYGNSQQFIVTIK